MSACWLNESTQRFFNMTGGVVPALATQQTWRYQQTTRRHSPVLSRLVDLAMVRPSCAAASDWARYIELADKYYTVY